MSTVQVWYDTYGPYRGQYAMQPKAAYKNTSFTWSVRFRVVPDTGFIYFRK